MNITQTSKTEWKDIDRNIVFEFPYKPDMAIEEAKATIAQYIQKKTEECMQRSIYSVNHHTIA
jgi:hypothetical protein